MRFPVFAIKGEDKETYYRHIHSAMENKPSVTMDDGADLVSILHLSISGISGSGHGNILAFIDKRRKTRLSGGLNRHFRYGK